MTIQREISILASSNPVLGASNVSATGDAFSLNLEQPLLIPQNARNINATLQESTIWYNTPNISQALLNNSLEIYDDVAANGSWAAATWIVLTLPTGLYSLSELNNSIDIQIQEAGGDAGLLTFIGDESTSKINLRINVAGIAVAFNNGSYPSGNATGHIGDILGATENKLPDPVILPAGTYGAPTVSVGIDNNPLTYVAKFNTVNSYLIHSDIVSQGLNYNGQYTGILGQVLITASPGNQIQSAPFNPPRIPADNLKGSRRTSFRFYLTDESNNPVDTLGEFFTCRVAITWTEPDEE